MRAFATSLFDLALPATCPGCGREGEPICAECRPALDVRLDHAPGVPIGLPAVLPAPLVQLEWCAPFNGLVRDALHALKYGGEQRLAQPLGQAAAARWRRAGAFDGRWAILIDDVTTTGATLAACADALIAAGALAVSALTIARER